MIEATQRNDYATWLSGGSSVYDRFEEPNFLIRKGRSLQ